jgi:hypothetical protein
MDDDHRRQGRSLLRYWLYLAAVIVIRYEGPFRSASSVG